MNTTESQSEAPGAPTASSPAAPAPAAPSAPQPGRRVRLLLAILAVATLLAVAFGGWRMWQAVQERIAAQQRIVDELDRRIAGLQAEFGQVGGELTQGQRQTGDAIADLRTRLDENEQGLARLGDAVRGGWRRYQLLAVEQLLLAANERLLLARDVAGADRALQLAESRLAALADPQLFPVREAITGERLALAETPRVEVSTLALTLAALIRRAPALPLAAEAGGHFEPPPPGTAPVVEDANWMERAWAKLRSALSAMFVLRREEGVEAQLLPQEHEALIRQILLLRLESARFAVLRGEAGAWRGTLEQAQAWLSRYYRRSDPGVAAMQSELDRLAGQEIAPPLPDVSQSLALLREHLDAPAE